MSIEWDCLKNYLGGKCWTVTYRDDKEEKDTKQAETKDTKDDKVDDPHEAEEDNGGKSSIINYLEYSGTRNWFSSSSSDDDDGGQEDCMPCF